MDLVVKVSGDTFSGNSKDETPISISVSFTSDDDMG